MRSAMKRKFLVTAHLFIASFLFAPIAARAAQEAPFTDCDLYAASDPGPDPRIVRVPFEKVDPKLAVPACQDAARLYPDSVRTQQELGRAYLKAESYDAALAQFRLAVKGGSPAAMNSLGYMYSQGFGVTADLAEAIRWYRSSAEQGFAFAERGLSSRYERGDGVPKDYGLALQWGLKAAEQGLPDVQDEIACFYAQGLGTSPDMAKANYWFTKAAAQGYAIAEYHLGESYEHGLGVDKDQATAIAWYRKAAAQGFAKAKDSLALLEVYAAAAPAGPSAPPPAPPPPENGQGHEAASKMESGKDWDPHVLPGFLSLMGATSTESATGKNHVIELTIDLEKAFANIKIMQSLGMLNHEKPQEFFTEDRYPFLVKLANLGGACALRSLYILDPGLENVKVTAFYMARDDFGHSVKRKIFDLQFTKAIIARIDWHGFDDEKLPVIAKSLEFDPQFMADARR